MSSVTAQGGVWGSGADPAERILVVVPATSVPPEHRSIIALGLEGRETLGTDRALGQ